MLRRVDARGMACPQPVLLTRAALQEDDELLVIVDNETARENVTRMVERAGSTVQSEARADGIYLVIRRGEVGAESAASAPASAPASEVAATGPLVYSIVGETMGRGDDELGQILIRGFFHALGQTNPPPDILIFYNSGVRLLVDDSPVLEDLCDLSERGVEILACGTCLGHFGLRDRLAVGEVSNMYSIVETLAGAGKVITI